jgi:hypothetical protein
MAVHHCEHTQWHWNWHFEMVKVINFISCIFYHKYKKRSLKKKQLCKHKQLAYNLPHTDRIKSKSKKAQKKQLWKFQVSQARWAKHEGYSSPRLRAGEGNVFSLHSQVDFSDQKRMLYEHNILHTPANLEYFGHTDIYFFPQVKTQTFNAWIVLFFSFQLGKMALQTACVKMFGWKNNKTVPSQGAGFIWTCDHAIFQINTASILSLCNSTAPDTLRVSVHGSNG